MYGTELIKKVIKNIVINAFVVNGNDKEVCVFPPFISFVLFFVSFWRISMNMETECGHAVHPVTLIDRAFFLFGENLPMIMKTSKRAPGPLHSNTRLHQCSISSRHDLPRNVLHCILVGTFWKFLLICRQLFFFFFSSIFFIVTLFFTTLAT